MKKLTQILLFSVLCTAVVQADFTQCHGVWTNKPCDENSPAKIESTTGSLGAPTKKPTEAPTATVSRNDTFFKRRSLFTSADLEAFRARRDGRGNVPLDEARDVCLDPQGSLETCSQLISAVLEKINSLKAPAPSVTSGATNTEVVNQVVVINHDENTNIIERPIISRPHEDPRVPLIPTQPAKPLVERKHLKGAAVQ